MTDKEYFTREEFVNMVEAYNKAEKERQELKAENEKLKEKTIKLSEEKGHLIVENNTLKEENFNFEEIVKLCRCEQYKQTLQEIKEIADARCNECKYGKDGISCKYGDCGEAKLHLITQLITKAEEE